MKLIYHILAVFSCGIIPRLAFTQPSIEWQHTIGGNATDLLFDMIPIEKGFLLVGGSSSPVSGDKTEPNAYIDAWIVKIDVNGAIVWQNTMGGSGYDHGMVADRTYDGGYIIGAFSESNIGGDKSENSRGLTDYWIIKIDGYGNVIWDKTIGGSDYDYIYGIEETSDQGFIVAGESKSNISGDKTENSNGGTDVWIVKLNSSGVIEWQNTIGGAGEDNLRAIQQTPDNGYIIGATSTSGVTGDKTEPQQGLSDYWVIKLSATGSIEWQNTIGGSGVDDLTSLDFTVDGGYIVCGGSTSTISGDKMENSFGSNSMDFWVLKLNSLGDIEWQHTLGGTSWDQPETIFQTASGQYFVSGISESPASGNKTESAEPNGDYWALKLDNLGNIVWQKNIRGDSLELLYSSAQSLDGGYLLGGHSLSGTGGDKTENCKGMSDYWVIKLEADESGLGVEDAYSGGDIISLYPNPTSSALYINTSLQSIPGIRIYNGLGQLLFTFSDHPSHLAIPLPKLSTGIYICEIDLTNGKRIHQRFMYTE